MNEPVLKTTDVSTIPASPDRNGDQLRDVADLPIEFFASITEDQIASYDRDTKITQILDNVDTSKCMVSHISESGKNTLRINNEGREVSQQIADMYLSDGNNGLVELLQIRQDLNRSGADDEQVKAKRKLINSAIGKIKYREQKGHAEEYLNSIGITYDNLGLNAADLTKLNRLASEQDTSGIYEYLDEREKYNSSRVASMLSVELDQVYPVVEELARFLGPEFGSGNTQVEESIDELLTTIGEVESCVNISENGGKQAVRINAKGRRVADQLLYEIAGEVRNYNLHPDSSLEFISDTLDERIKMLKQSGSSDSLVRILQSAKGKVEYRIWKNNYQFDTPYASAINYKNAQASEYLGADKVVREVVENDQTAIVIDALSGDTEKITAETAGLLGVEEYEVAEVTAGMAQTITAENSMEKKRRKWPKIRTRVKLLVASTTILIGLGLGIVAKPGVVSASNAKELAKSTFYNANEKFGDADCEALAAYVDDTGDYSILPRILQSWIPGGLSCRDVAPPGFMFMSEIGESEIDLGVGEDIVLNENIEVPVVENEAIKTNYVTELTVDEPSVGVTETSGGESTLVDDSGVGRGADVDLIGNDIVQEEAVNTFIQRPVENITLSEEVRNQILHIDSLEDAHEFLSTLSPEYLGTNIEKDPDSGITYLYYSLPSEISSNEYIRQLFGSDLQNLLGQKLPENVISKIVYFPDESKGMLTPGLWQGENRDYAEEYYGADAGSIVKAAGGGDKVFADFVVDWLWEGEKKEPFRPTNRIGGIEGSSFRNGDIAANTEFLCVDRQTGKWWVTNWENVPKDNPDIDVANLLWAWTDQGNFNPNPIVGGASLRHMMSGKLNQLLMKGPSGIPAQGTAFRSVTDESGVTSSQVIYSNTFLSLVAPNIYGHILQTSPTIDLNGNIVNLGDTSSIHAGSTDQKYVFGLMPETGRFRDISGSQPFGSPENYDWVNNIVGFAITN